MKKGRKKKNEFVRFWLPLALLAVLTLTAIFWNNVSWIANANIWRQLLSDAFPQLFPRPYVLLVKKSMTASSTIQSANRSQITTAPANVIKSAPALEQQKPRRDMLTIPKINITAPIITAQTDNAQVVHGLLDSGVVLYPGSTAFGQTGQTVLLGHSAPAGWPKINYDWVFSQLNELKKGDMVVVTYNYETRYYQVVRTRVVTPQEGVPDPTVTGNSLMLVSCWPPGKDLKRIAVEATIMDK
jgi:LPXTG-site transpeptidase (sortase) family protein